MFGGSQNHFNRLVRSKYIEKYLQHLVRANFLYIGPLQKKLETYFDQKMEGVTYHVIKPQISYIEASISCIAYQDPQTLQTSGLLVYFVYLDHF